MLKQTLAPAHSLAFLTLLEPGVLKRVLGALEAPVSIFGEEIWQLPILREDFTKATINQRKAH